MSATRPPLTVLHACPDCSIGKANPFCAYCGGRGTVPEAVLARWQRDVYSGVRRTGE